MKKELRWAVLGTGVIANEMAQALTAMGKPLYAVGNRTLGKALAFAEKHQVRKVYRDFHEMFWDPLVDIIYITTPHNTHIDFLRTALKNGKHVLCEKSITLNSNELREAVTLAENHDVILAEAMTIWHMPLYQKLCNMVRIGIFGKVQMLQLNFGSLKEYNMNSRFFNLQLAGGALLDIGVYALSLVRSFMDSQPEDILSQVKLASTGVDEQAGILLMNREEQMATISLSLHSKQPKRAVISCERAYIEIMEYPRADKAVIVDAETGKRQEITEGKTAHALQYEIMDMEKAVLNHSVDSMHLAETIDGMEIMTKLRRDWGLQYPDE